MNLASRLSHRAGLLALFSACLIVSGCHKNVTALPKQVEAPPPPARPTVTVDANPTAINKFDSSTLSYNSTHATQLSIDAGEGAVNALGSNKFSPTDST